MASNFFIIDKYKTWKQWSQINILLTLLKTLLRVLERKVQNNISLHHSISTTHKNDGAMLLLPATDEEWSESKYTHF